MSKSTAIDDRRTSGEQRRAYWITGVVQGVGFRPFVHRTAIVLNLAGFVRNQSGLVYLEVEGPASTLDEFERTIRESPPPLARVSNIRWQLIEVKQSTEFHIEESVATSFHEVSIAPDASICAACLAELFDPADRRYLYPFINCMNCGPRLTIIRGAPYDRSRTTMSAFPMCSACRREYENPLDRRFHAQPIACPDCGPQLQLTNKMNEIWDCLDPITVFANEVRAGQIGALKGLGGFHLVCDATSEPVVEELRQRKHRDEKPFAIMVADIQQAQSICEVNAQEAELLRSTSAPIVLLHRRRSPTSIQIAASVAPGIPYLGVMLPYTPVHHLLMRSLQGLPVVMTSGNLSDEPMAHENVDALARLSPIADLFLIHNRPIEVRCDDSVVRATRGCITMLRRSRGFAPESLVLPIKLPEQTLAAGGQLKSTFALGRDRLAFVSHHLGDLDHFSAYQAYERDVRLYERLFEMDVRLFVHDLHPDYASTRFAENRADELHVHRIAVQHHHAHVASAMAEHELIGPVIGVAFDGTGYGVDRTIWGGEFLIASYAVFERAAHLRYVGLPGGDAAIREPWRCAMAHLHDAGCALPDSFSNFSVASRGLVQQLIERQFNTPLTSSMGRLFDAISALIGVRSTTSYEGQAAMELEFCAEQSNSLTPYPIELTNVKGECGETKMVVDTRPIIRAVLQDMSSRVKQCDIASRFHSTIAHIVRVVCRDLREARSLEQVVLSGGVFLNQRLLTETTQLLVADNFQVYSQSKLPCHDGGISFGQLAIAAAIRSKSK